MKSKASRSFRTPFFRLPLLALPALCTITGARAASDVWSATATSGDWSLPANWVGGTPSGATSGTTNTDTATFNVISAFQAINVDAGRNLQNITFAVNSTYTLQGSPLLLTNGGTILSNGVAGDERITSALAIQGDSGSYTIQTDTPGANRELIISAGGVTGSSTAGNNTNLLLTGASGGSNAISAVIADGAGGGTLSLTKEGTGLWILSSGANTYSGGTTVTAGTLRDDNSGNSTVALGFGKILMNGGTLRLQNSSGANLINPIDVGANSGTVSFRGNSNFNPTAFTGTGVLNIVGDTNVTVSSLSYANFEGTLNLGNGVGTNIFRLDSGFAETSLSAASVNLKPFARIAHRSGTNGTITTNIGTLAGDAGSIVGDSAAGGGTFVYSVGAREEDSTFSGAIIDGGTKTGLTKVGFAKLTLAGPNTYTGTTTVSEGVLSLSSAYLADASALVIGIDGKLDLNFPGRDRVASLTIDGTTLPDGVYNSSDPDYGSFFSGSGSIQIGDVADGYQDWVTDYGLQNPWLGVDPALNGTPAADPDNDGSPNSLEYALGGSPVSGSDGPRIYPIVKDSDIDGDALPEQLLTIAVRSDTPAFSAGPQPSATVGDYTYTIQGSTDLATFTTAVQPVPTAVLPDAPAPAGYEYRTFSLTGSNGTPARGFMRVKVGH